MSDHAHHHAGPSPEQGFWRSRTGSVFIGFGVIAAAYLLFEHTAHVFQWLPFGILLLCPLMHFFMHGSHGGHGGSDGPRPGARS
ncbi:DUF2933 domain-containing protein [Roseomonas sp. HJA6]|uniref:DUF2933 domain-containing protein n=1 Tax=Roseomonas alba TaxID=2846776 RepID=A0ABS7AL70_9PROT|nr:DUF2933 domain-containing protein [Neoroseomonas alba]MBW6402095.1 DUF2933 domain-containing protein [Neoroseomonas alba]